MKRKFARNIAALTDVFEFLQQCFALLGVDAGAAYAVDLAVEEFFTNMVKYSRGGRGDISLHLQRNGDTLVVRLLDEDVEPFDITNLPEVDTKLPLQDRKIGGLGIHLAKHLVDSLAYEYANRCSTITMMKKLEIKS